VGAAGSADPDHVTARAVLGRRFRPGRHSLVVVPGIDAGAFAAHSFDRVGPIQSVGVGEPFPAARSISPADHLLPPAVLSSRSGQGGERSAATAREASSSSGIGTPTCDGSEAGAKTEARHPA